MRVRETPERSIAYTSWPTPPLSAHESRRPSLTYSALSDPSYASSTSIYSQPSTPVRSMQANSNFSHESNACTNMHTPSSYPIHQLNEPFHQAVAQSSLNGFSTPAYSQPTFAYTAPANLPHGLDMNSRLVGPEQRPYWQDAEAAIGAAHASNTVFRPHLMTIDTSFGQAQPCQPSFCSHQDSSMESLHVSQDPNACHSIQATAWQEPQVVVPSQLTPHDEFTYQYDHPDNPGLDSKDLTCSFDSSTSGYSGYDTLEPPSPDQTYFAPSDDDMIIVKPEPFHSPSPGSGSWYRPSLAYRPQVHAPLRTRKRGNKRQRRAAASGEAYNAVLDSGLPGQLHRRDLVEVRIDPKCARDKQGGLVLNEPSHANKPHVCTEVGDDGKPCLRRFERSEHLKRHMGSHSTERPYPCPLHIYGLCNRKIGRPDNAVDHIKTHLKGPRKGARNKHCTWAQMETAIRETFCVERATKLLTNVLKWYKGEEGRID